MTELKPLVVFDYSVWLHDLYYVMGGETGVMVPQSATDSTYVPVWKSDHVTGIMKAYLLEMLSGAWLRDRYGEVDTLLVFDMKNATGGYWRTEYLKRPDVLLNRYRPSKKRKKELQAELKADAGTYYAVGDDRLQTLAISYKGGRKFPEYRFRWLRDRLRALLEEMGVHGLGCPSYEADDMASLLVRANQLGTRHIIMATVDTDWLGLVDEALVSWVCQKGYAPQVRDNMETINEWASKKKFPTFNAPADIWAYKSQVGDKSDNLPAGSPIEVIDLLHPPEEFDLLVTAWGHRARIELMLDRTMPSLEAAKRARSYLAQLGLPMILRPVSFTYSS
jgi:5'-3' exonuclease